MLYYSIHSDIDIEIIMNIAESQKINYSNFTMDMCTIAELGVLNNYLFIFKDTHKKGFYY